MIILLEPLPKKHLSGAATTTFWGISYLHVVIYPSKLLRVRAALLGKKKIVLRLLLACVRGV